MSVITPTIKFPVIEESLINLIEGVDLVVTDFVAPSSAISRNEIELSWTVINQGTEATTASFWYDYVFLSTDTVYDADDIYVDSYSPPEQLAPGAAYKVDRTAFLKNPPTSGDYYLLVITDLGDRQAEADESNNVKYLPITVILPAVDLVVSSITAPSTVEIGKLINFSWTVTNQGITATKYYWDDAVYLSTDAIYDYSDLYITGGDGQPLEPGQSYTTTVSDDFTKVLTVGDYYLILVTNNLRYEEEVNKDNNTKAVPITVTAPNVDLVVTSVTAPSTVVIGSPFNISWTVTNRGTDATIPSWKDIAYFSFNVIFGGNLLTNFVIGDAQGLSLASEESYTISASVELNDTLEAGNYYIFVEADSLNDQPETDNTNNFASAVVTGIKSPVDLELTSFHASSSAKPGDEIELSWTVTNISTQTTDASSWLDTVVLKSGDTLNPGELLISYPITDVIGLPLDPGESYTVNKTVKLPDRLDDDFYYFSFSIDAEDKQAESSSYNNSVYLSIAIIPDVDLVVSSATVPPMIAGGEDYEISWTVTNQGTKPTFSSFWYERVYLSTDETFDDSDSYLTEMYIRDSLPLASGESYTIDMFSNIVEAGNYYLLFVSDRYNHQPERDEDNNVKAIPITVTTPNVDLVVTSATAPLTITSGKSPELSWTVTNQGTEATTSYRNDAVYLSTDETFDDSDSYVAESLSYNSLPLAPGENYTIVTNYLNYVVPIIADAGDYYLLFISDRSNDIPETDKDNNVKAVPITVTAPVVDLVPNGGDTYPSTLASGEPLVLVFGSTNQGSDTTADYWFDEAYLSTDRMFDDSDILVVRANNDDRLPLEAGESYSLDNIISSLVADAGDYYILFVSDQNNNIPETDETNNVKAVPFTVTTPDVDLAISDVSVPATAKKESTIDLSWTVTNQGTDATTISYWFDYVLFSTDTTVDKFPEDIDLVYSQRFMPLAPGESYTVNESTKIPNVAAGHYYLLFVNNIQEDTDLGNNVVVVPFSVVQSSMIGTADSNSLVGTDGSESIEALAGRDRILANGGDDLIMGGTGGDTITGGAGADQFVYQTFQDIGDAIVDFTVNEDQIDIGELLDSFNYQGSDPVTDGYLRSFQGSNGTSVQIDTDGLTGSGIFRPFIFLENVAANDLTLSDFLV